MEIQTQGTITDSRGSKVYLYLVVLVATLGGFLLGYQSLIISPAMIFMREQFHLSENQAGFAVSSALLGALIGSAIAGIVSDCLGRRKALVIAAVGLGVSAVGTAVAPNMLVFNLFRIIGGVGMGMAMAVSPIYIAEIAPARMRGILVTAMQIVIVSGSVLALAVCYFLSTGGEWRWMMASALAPAVVLLAGLVFVPESPRWLLENDRDDEALHVLTRVNGRKQAQKETREIKAAIEDERSREAATWQEMFRPGIRTALVIGVGLAIVQQFSGGSSLITYSPMILQNAGFPTPKTAVGVSVIHNIYNLVCVFIALALVERIGRRSLLIFGVSGMAIGHAVLFVFFLCSIRGLPVPIVLMLTTGVSNISIGPLAWVVMSEIFPTNIRGRAMALATFILFLSAWINIYVFPIVEGMFKRSYGNSGGVFLVYSVLCVLGVLFMWLKVPETKGRSLEEISASFVRISGRVYSHHGRERRR